MLATILVVFAMHLVTEFDPGFLLVCREPTF
jgi:hypothetical protein